MYGRDNGELPPRPDLSRKYTVEEAKDLAIGWANYWLNHPKKPPGHQLHRKAVAREALVPANWERALRSGKEIGEGIDPDKLPIFGGDGEHFDYDDAKGKALLDRARCGDRDADAALAYIAMRYLRAGREMPCHLTEYVIGLLSLRFLQNPPRGKGGDPYANVARDGFIVSALSWLDRMGFSPTKNEATDKPTGSFIVAEALQQLGFDIDYAGVAKVWRRKRDLVDTIAERYPHKAKRIKSR